MSVPFIFVNGQSATPEILIEQNETGIDVLTFETREEDPILRGLRYEDTIQFDGRVYRIKAISNRNGTVKVESRLDICDLRTTYIDLILGTDYSDSVAALLATVFSRANWSYLIEGAWSDEFEDMTVEDNYRGSVIAILQQINEKFGVCFRFDPEKAFAVVYDPYGVDPNITPVLLHEDVNLKEVDCKGDTYEIATRLYPYGQDKNGNALSITSVNGGKAYVDCMTYTDTIYPQAWEYDTPTTAKGLLAVTKRKIRQICVPNESFQFDVIDLYRVDPELWKHYHLRVGTVAHYYDKISGQTKRMQVTKIIENGRCPEQTVVEIAYRPILGGVG